jgi:hypothetical protein
MAGCRRRSRTLEPITIISLAGNRSAVDLAQGGALRAERLIVRMFKVEGRDA